MRNQWIEYNPRLKQIARKLRKDMTLSEILLWQQIKGKQLLGYDFHRQKPIDEYVVDFYCPRLKLVLEIDGDSHEGKEEDDKIRQEKLESSGLTVMRFWDWDVKDNVDGLLNIYENGLKLIEHTRKIKRPPGEGTAGCVLLLVPII